MYPEVTSVYIPVKTKDYRALAILLSVIGHIVLIGAIVYFHHETPPPPMQTVLISPQELADIQSQIQANLQSGENSAGESPNQQTQTDPNTAKLMQQIAEQEALFQQNKAKMAEQIDKEFHAQQQQIIERLDAELAEKKATIDEFEKAEANIDEIEATLRAEMDEARRQNAEHIESLRIKTEHKNIATDGEQLIGATMSNTRQNTNNTSNASSRTGLQSENSSSYLNAIKSKIYSNWNPPTNSDGKSLRVTIRLSPSGTVISTSITGDDPFAKSLKEAINKSSPLPVPSDPVLFQKNFANLTIRFTGE